MHFLFTSYALYSLIVSSGSTSLPRCTLSAIAQIAHQIVQRLAFTVPGGGKRRPPRIRRVYLPKRPRAGASSHPNGFVRCVVPRDPVLRFRACCAHGCDRHLSLVLRRLRACAPRQRLV
jgi:hypothetical protein